MHVDKARKYTLVLSAIALINCILNTINYGADPYGVLTFLYIATILAIISQVFMIGASAIPEHYRERIMKHSIILAKVIFGVDVLFGIASFQWITRF